jgi:hypothetical protein
LEGIAGGDVEAVRRFTDAMPSADVYISLVTAAHSNRQTKWLPNDIFDIDALNVAVPYCDIVVSERHAIHVLKAAGVAKRLETRVLTTLEQLTQFLAD